jgi:hypothetical protein
LFVDDIVVYTKPKKIQKINWPQILAPVILVLELTEMLGKTRCGLNCYKTLPTPGLVSGVTNMREKTYNLGK